METMTTLLKIVTAVGVVAFSGMVTFYYFQEGLSKKTFWSGVCLVLMLIAFCSFMST